VSVNLIRETPFDFMRCQIGKCFDLQFAKVILSIKDVFIYTISVFLFASPQKPTKGDQTSLDL